MTLDTIHNIDCLEGLRQMPDDYVDCVISSPPYWGLRDYGVNGQLGLESTIDEYISNMTEVFREVRRVLKPTGTLWLNMGDSYNSDPCHNGKSFRRDRAEVIPSKRIPRGGGRWGGGNNYSPYLKTKDLCGMPWRLAFALRADGWYLRSDIIWAKNNPMPESVTDRPTKAHEYLFLMSKEAKYYYDADAIREEYNYDGRKQTKHLHKLDGSHDNHKSIYGKERWPDRSGRNRRTVWTIATQPFGLEMCSACRAIYFSSEYGRLEIHIDDDGTKHTICKCGIWDQWVSHFATFPEALVEPCILAGTSERGNCAECGKPWVRVVEKLHPPTRSVKTQTPGGQTPQGAFSKERFDDPIKINTIGWQPQCLCLASVERPIVLDPFMGSGTVALVAARYNRHFIGFELNKEYCELARKRVADELAQKKLF